MTDSVPALIFQTSDAPLIPVFEPMPRRDRMLRDLGVREAMELADDLADRIEATDPAGATLLRRFRRDAAATLIRQHDATPVPAVDIITNRGILP